VLNPDAGMISRDLPTISYALRGIAYFEVRIHGPDHDLHSGTYGGVVHNPAQVLADLIAGMHDAKGRVTLPGYYDKVRQLSKQERAELARLPMGEDYYLKQTGVPALWGEQGYTPVERTGARPTLEVNGLLSGFTGAGSKTVLPAWAMAKISMRLVPDQDPLEIKDMLLRYLKEQAPRTVRYDVIEMPNGAPSISDITTPAVQALGHGIGLGQATTVRPRGRFGAGGGANAAHPGRRLNPDRLRPAGRQPACAQRKAESADLVPGHRYIDPLPAEPEALKGLSSRAGAGPARS
jgi:acetylornithine deacetylase/succinyl-diaminopimelate desuccinylase-like protein